MSTSLNTDLLLGLNDPLPVNGRHSGFVRIPYSSNSSAYGFVPLPLAIVSGDDGPTVLLIAGTFGDELESQVALARVARQLDPATIRGRVIMLPTANAPAARAGTRNSPLDGRNLNRSFPGDVLGTPTSVIADYIERRLMPVSDLVIDTGSDGRSFRYVPSATLIYHADPDTRARRLAIALAFGAPTTLMFYVFEDRTTSGAAHRAGTVRIATEIGGPDPIGMTIAGILRVLRWAGMIDAAEAPRPRPTVKTVRQESDFVYALHHGVFEPACPLGTEVAAGDLAGHIYDVGRPFSTPVEIRFASAGTVVCTRGAGLAAPGDCLMHLATSPDPELEAECEAAARLAWLPTQIADRPRRRVPRSRKDKT